MMLEVINTLVREIREELGLSRGVPPKIEKIIEHNDGSLHIITSDRAEKSLLLGPGGRIAAELAKRTSKKFTIYGIDELILREHRLKLTLHRIDEVYESSDQVQKQFLQILRSIVIDEEKHPENPSHRVVENEVVLKIAVAFSGGIDSSAAIYILKQKGINPDAITVQLGDEFYTRIEMQRIQRWCEENSINQVSIKPFGKIDHIIQSTKEGRIHPCGKCHEIIQESVKHYARENQYFILVTGELLPNGRQSIVQEEGLLVVHLPAALGLSKYRTEILAEDSGKILSRRRFGCRLVAEANRKGWRNIGPSIFRILRELEAGVLTTGQGLEYIKDIAKSSMSEKE